MNSDPFEQQCRQQPFRAIPTEWRQEILNAAGSTPPEAAPVPSSFREWVKALIWPAPGAWVTVGVAWGVILFLNLMSSPERTSASPVAETQVLPPIFRLALVEQERLRAELLGIDRTALPVSKPRRDGKASPQSMRIGLTSHC